MRPGPRRFRPILLAAAVILLAAEPVTHARAAAGEAAAPDLRRTGETAPRLAGNREMAPLSPKKALSGEPQVPATTGGAGNGDREELQEKRRQNMRDRAEEAAEEERGNALGARELNEKVRRKIRATRELETEAVRGSHGVK